MEDRFETFTILISRINRSIRKIKNQEMADWGLKSIHVSCLHYLRSQGSLTAAELRERCEEDKAAVSRAIDHLKSEGFIEHSANGAKLYKCPLVLTKKGEQAGDAIAQKIATVLREIDDSLTDEQRAAFYQSLAAVSDRLGTIASEPIEAKRDDERARHVDAERKRESSPS